MHDLEELSQIMQRALALPMPEKRRFEVRYSVQPYCPRMHYLLEKQNSDESYMSGSMEAIVGGGSALHAGLQRRLWTLAQELEDFELVGVIDENGEYVEFEFLREGKPSGHCDGLVKWRGRYYVLEIKTVHLDKLALLRDVNTPKTYNTTQAQCYAHEFKQKGIEIAGILLLYVERNRFEDLELFFVEVKDEVATGYIQLVDYGKECIQADCLPEGICRDGVEAAYCPVVNECFSLRNPVLFYDEGFRQLVNIIYPKDPPQRRLGALARWK